MAFYRPLLLNNVGIQTRLCTLLPASFEDSIKCRIEAVELNSNLEFEALSYTWGDPNDLLPVEVNEETILVTKNLETALRYLRKETESRYLWIDAICINQNDIDERNKQVAVMIEIYTAAKLVISWLGIRDQLFDPFVEMGYATILFRHIRFLKEYLPFQSYLESNGIQAPYSGFQDHKDTFNNGIYSLQLLIGEREREKPVYWQRAWIVQEVAAARALILQSGPYIISEEDIELVTEFISSPKVATLLMDGRYEQRKLRAYFRTDSFTPISVYRSLLYSSQDDKEKRIARIRGPFNLLALLRHNRSRFCTDKRDKVYSVLGLCDQTIRSHPGILVDYNRSITDIYVGVTQALIESSCSLEVLCSANLAETSALPGLPSWVPNWSIQLGSDVCDRPISYHHQWATGNMPATTRFWKDIKTCTLSVVGFCFGSVLGLKDPFVKLDMDIAQNEDMVSKMMGYTSLYHQLSRSYRDLVTLLHPKPLSGDLFRRTCSLGLLHHDLDDSFRKLMDELDLNVDSDHISEGPIKSLGDRFRYKFMASRVNSQCMFALQATPLTESTRFADGLIGIASPGVIRKGDLLCLLLGCGAPLILRPTGNRYLVVCPAYVDNLMDGSAMVYLQNGLFKLATFDLE